MRISWCVTVVPVLLVVARPMPVVGQTTLEDVRAVLCAALADAHDVSLTLESDRRDGGTPEFGFL